MQIWKLEKCNDTLKYKSKLPVGSGKWRFNKWTFESLVQAINSDDWLSQEFLWLDNWIIDSND